MNIDFIEATGIFSGKDTPFLGHLQLWSDNKALGRQTYIVRGQRNIQILYTPSNGSLVLRGSIMYFAQGHNFTYDKKTFIEAIDYLGRILHISLWNMYLTILECGVIVEVGSKPKEIIQHHREGKKMELHENPKDRGNFRSFNDKLAHRKLYDAGRNIRCKQGMRMKDIIKAAGWNPESHYLKWEVHYIKPEASLNNGIGIRLCDIVNSQWEDIFKADIFAQYKRLTPMKSIIPPKDKSNLHALDIFAIELVETKMNEGSTLPEVQKMLYSRINASAILSKADKDARKRQVKATLDKLEQSEVSAWDISRELKAALELADEPQA